MSFAIVWCTAHNLRHSEISPNSLMFERKKKIEKINYSELFDTQQHSIASKTKKFAFVFSFALGFLELNQLNGITYGTSIGHNYLFGNR